VQPALVFGELDPVAARDRFERVEVAATDRTQDCVIGESGALGDLFGREDVPTCSVHRSTSVLALG
jgi:hypothetical protein